MANKAPTSTTAIIVRPPRRASRVSRLRAVARRASAAVAPVRTRIVERVSRISAGARGGIGRARGVARNAAERASSILAGSTGKIIAMVVTVAAMVALIPVFRRYLRLDGKPHASYIMAAVFLGVALVLWKYFKRPAWALAAGAVCGFLVGTQILGSVFTPNPPPQAALQPSVQVPAQLPAAGQPGTPALPDRAGSGAPVPARPTTAAAPYVPAGVPA